jgi:transcriptional regulator with XRE-family HTH domain
MVIGERLKDLRELKKMSQGDIEKRTGLLRCYISRVENGHTVPSVETLEKIARALEIPLYRLFTDDAHVKLPDIPTQSRKGRAVNPKDERELGISPSYSLGWMIRTVASCFTWHQDGEEGLGRIFGLSKTCGRST